MEISSVPSSVHSPILGKSLSRPVVLDKVALPKGSIHIVREDLLPGGTKQRAVIPYLCDVLDAGAEEVVYASPFCGFAQVALAFCGQEMGVPVTLFCERDPAQNGLKSHEFTALAESFGAKVILVETLASAELEAISYAAQKEKVFKIPLGFQDDSFKFHMKDRIREQLHLIEEEIRRPIKRIWLPVGSGTLASIFHEVIGSIAEILCVDVRVLPAEDVRISRFKNLPNVTFFRAKERFHEKSQGQPPVPSNVHYDAKLWSFILENHQDGDVWWNVAR